VLKECLVNHARTFIFSTALPGYIAAQIGAAMQLSAGMDCEREALLKSAGVFRKALRAEDLDTAASDSQIVPVVLGANEATLDAAEHLQREGFAVRGIRPPTVPQGSSRLRLSLTARIPQHELTRLVASLGAWRSHQGSFVSARHA
jgi:8-amino-7-oxononanoate synthase